MGAWWFREPVHDAYFLQDTVQCARAEHDGNGTHLFPSSRLGDLAVGGGQTVCVRVLELTSPPLSPPPAPFPKHSCRFTI
jgi:hypothetical protein